MNFDEIVLIGISGTGFLVIAIFDKNLAFATIAGLISMGIFVFSGWLLSQNQKEKTK